MTALYIILGIILFFILVLSVKVKVTVHSEDGVDLSVKWLFLKFTILPKHEKKPKKEKKKKKKEKPEDEKKDETVKEPKEKKGDNIFVRYYRNNGVSGTVELIERAASALGGMFRRMGKAFTFEELYVYLLVGAGDSAETAIKYGKTCEKVFPAMGFITSVIKTKKYSLDVKPDFLEGQNKAKLHTTVSIIPRRMINAVIILVFALIFKVVIKFLKGSRAKKAGTPEEKNNTNLKEKGEKQ